MECFYAQRLHVALQAFILACGTSLTPQILWASGIILPWALSQRTIDDILWVLSILDHFLTHLYAIQIMLKNKFIDSVNLNEPIIIEQWSPLPIPLTAGPQFVDSLTCSNSFSYYGDVGFKPDSRGCWSSILRKRRDKEVEEIGKALVSSRDKWGTDICGMPQITGEWIQTRIP